MRVLFWSELFWPYGGGAQFSALRLLRGLRTRGHEFMVVTRQDDPGLPEVESFDDFPIRRFPFYAALEERNLDKVIRIRREISSLKREFSPELVHVNCFGLSVMFHLDTVKASPAPFLLTLRSEKYNPARDDNTALERALRSADWITGPSARTVEYARELVPDIDLPASHIYNGVEPPELAPAPLPWDAPQLLCLGRLEPNKGIDLAIAAFARLRERYPAIRLTVAGDGPARGDLENQVGELGIGPSVEFPGWVAPEHVPALLNTVTIVVVPSRGWEALPLVAIEAALMARPVVASRDAGLPEVVLDGETGLIVDKEDVGGLAGAIERLLEERDLAEQMGRAARSRAQEVFSIERCIDAYDSLYGTLRKQPAAASA